MWEGIRATRPIRPRHQARAIRRIRQFRAIRVPLERRVGGHQGHQANPSVSSGQGYPADPSVPGDQGTLGASCGRASGPPGQSVRVIRPGLSGGSVSSGRSGCPWSVVWEGIRATRPIRPRHQARVIRRTRQFRAIRVPLERRVGGHQGHQANPSVPSGQGYPADPSVPGDQGTLGASCGRASGPPGQSVRVIRPGLSGGPVSSGRSGYPRSVVWEGIRATRPIRPCHQARAIRRTRQSRAIRVPSERRVGGHQGHQANPSVSSGQGYPADPSVPGDQVPSERRVWEGIRATRPIRPCHQYPADPSVPGDQGTLGASCEARNQGYPSVPSGQGNPAELSVQGYGVEDSPSGPSDQSDQGVRAGNPVRGVIRASVLKQLWERSRSLGREQAGSPRHTPNGTSRARVPISLPWQRGAWATYPSCAGN